MSENRQPPPVALTIAGSDPSGGAGIQADLKTMTVLGVYGASAITALTAQNTHGVRGVHPVPASFVAEQIDAVLDDLDVRAVKTGMLADADIIDVVAGRAERGRLANLVVDPVMVATSGDLLLARSAVDRLRDRLLPVARVVTPNVHEAAVLTGSPAAATLTELVAQGRAILALGAPAVLMKGGHLSAPATSGAADAVDILVEPQSLREFRSDRIETRHTHGSGCTLSAAIAARLACGDDLGEAIAAAKAFVAEAIAGAAAAPVGGGNAPLDHFCRLRGAGGGARCEERR